MNTIDILKAQSPAALAEEYIVKSIWNNYFPPGTDLPAERDLAERIGVTRTTLREVLQRLARDGWLHIQHGKPTRVNDIWETAGPNIIKTVLKLDKSYLPIVVANTVALRTRMSDSYIPEAIKNNPEASARLFEGLEQLEDTAIAYAEFDYRLYRQFAFIATKPVYALILNTFKEIYYKVAELFFANPECRKLMNRFYRELLQACIDKDVEKATSCMKFSRQTTAEIWERLIKNIPDSFAEN